MNPVFSCSFSAKISEDFTLYARYNSSCSLFVISLCSDDQYVTQECIYYLLLQIYVSIRKFTNVNNILQNVDKYVFTRLRASEERSFNVSDFTKLLFRLVIIVYPQVFSLYYIAEKSTQASQLIFENAVDK